MLFYVGKCMFRVQCSKIYRENIIRFNRDEIRNMNLQDAFVMSFRKTPDGVDFKNHHFLLFQLLFPPSKQHTRPGAIVFYEANISDNGIFQSLFITTQHPVPLKRYFLPKNVKKCFVFRAFCFPSKQRLKHHKKPFERGEGRLFARRRGRSIGRNAKTV